MSAEATRVSDKQEEPATALCAAQAAVSPARRARLDSVDLLRGTIMALMLLDHTRDFFSADLQINPTDLARTTPALFFTRWVTHFCAPVFLFLAGTGAWLWAARGRSRGELARYLVARGLWLVFLELTVLRLGMMFNLNYNLIFLSILWAIGWSMVALGALVFLPTPLVGLVGIAMIAAHNLLDGYTAAQLGLPGWLWTVLHQQAPLPVEGRRVVFVVYPLIPWIGVMAAGYAFGPLLRLEPPGRKRVLLGLGLALTAAFVALRAANVYGDPRPWSAQASATYTLMSFLNCQKYPPSLLFLLMTLGPAIALLAVLDRPVSPLARPLLTLGRVPLFLFLLQWPLLHGLAIALAAATGRPYAWLIANGPFSAPAGYGFRLPIVYLLWASCLALLYPACAWFARVKARRRDWWLTYL